MTPDSQLLTRYANDRDEAAFADLVQGHLNHVYSTAVRLVGGDEHFAEDVAQAVFTELARKAGSLCDRPVLSGWLHTTTRFMAAKVVRAEQRRCLREQTALTMPSNSTASSEPDWDEVRAFLDETIGELSDPDRDAIMLRYFEKKPLAEVGAALGVSEDAARMRVDRAVDKLRTRLALRGIVSTAAALSTALAENLVATAPTALGSRVIARALGSTATAGASSGWSMAGKLAMATAFVAIVGILVGFVAFKPTPTAMPASLPQVASAAQAAPAGPPPVPAIVPSSKTTPGNPSSLTLLFIDRETAFPITNQAATLKGWEKGSQLLVQKAVRLEQGRSPVPFDPNCGPDFRIYAHVEGYADVHLTWQPKNGEVIPGLYTVRLSRPALIHGRVVDSTGKPVAGATVGFNTEKVAAPVTVTEDYSVDYLTVKTDANGYWEINRLAPEIVRHLFGGASHPEYSRSEMLSTSRQPELVQQFLDGTAVFHLGEGIVVRGTVLDENGRPIGSALVRVGQMSSSQLKEAHTETDGSFIVRGCQPGRGIATAELEGYAPAAQALNLEPNLAPVKLTLGAGQVLRLRVVDPTGNPVPGASVMLDSFPRAERAMPIPQVEFRRKTDDEGRLVWENAPDQPLEFDIAATGFVRLNSVHVKPSDQEHVVTLSPALVISGTVRDATTRELIPSFRIGIGWPEQGPDGTMQPRWSDLDRFWLKFSGGEFRHPLQEMVIGGSVNRGYIFRFEADGYKPFVTRVYQPNEGEVRVDVELRLGQEISAVAYTADGKPASAAQVALVSPGYEVRLVPGGFAGELGHALAWLRRAGEDGQFVVPDDETIERVIITTADGYAETSVAELRKVRAVRLGAWCGISGVLTSKGQPVPNAEIRLVWTSSPLVPSFQAQPVHTDSEGRFAFAQVPPGTFQVSAVSAGADRSGTIATAKVELAPGEMKQVALGDAAAQTQ